MGPWRKRTAQEDEAHAREALERTVTILRGWQGGGITTVAVADVLGMLGDWPETVPVRNAPAHDPGADPLTGARWAGPPGSAPPGTG